MARAPRAGDRVGAGAAWAEGLDADPVHRAPAPLADDGALGLAHGAAARLERPVRGCGGGERARAEARAADASGSTTALPPPSPPPPHAPLNEDGTPAFGLLSGAHAQRLEPHASAPSDVPSLVSVSSTPSSPPDSLPSSPPPSPLPDHVIEQQERGRLHPHGLPVVPQLTEVD